MPIAAIMPACRAFAAIAEEKVRRQAVQKPDEEICPAGTPAPTRIARLAAIKSSCTRGGGGAWPGGLIVSQGSQFGSFSPGDSASKALEPFARIRKLCRECASDFRSDFIAAAPDPRTEGGDHVFGLGAEFHLHAPQSLFRDAPKRSSPARVNRGHGFALWCRPAEWGRNRRSAPPAERQARA